MLEESRRLALKQKANNLYSMELGACVFFDDRSSWLRVPGGWVYVDLRGTVFIPYNEEFRTKYHRKSPVTFRQSPFSVL